MKQTTLGHDLFSNNPPSAGTNTQRRNSYRTRDAVKALIEFVSTRDKTSLAHIPGLMQTGTESTLGIVLKTVSGIVTGRFGKPPVIHGSSSIDAQRTTVGHNLFREQSRQNIRSPI